MSAHEHHQAKFESGKSHNVIGCETTDTSVEVKILFFVTLIIQATAKYYKGTHLLKEGSFHLPKIK